MTVFDMLREQMRIIFRSINDTVTAKVSLDRVSDFLKNVRALLCLAITIRLISSST